MLADFVSWWRGQMRSLLPARLLAADLPWRRSLVATIGPDARQIDLALRTGDHEEHIAAAKDELKVGAQLVTDLLGLAELDTATLDGPRGQGGKVEGGKRCILGGLQHHRVAGGERLGHEQSMVTAFHGARPGDQRQRQMIAEADGARAFADRHDGVCSKFCGWLFG